MNIYDFLLTVVISLSVGVVIGCFLRDLTRSASRYYRNNMKRSRFFEQDLSINNNKKFKS